MTVLASLPDFLNQNAPARRWICMLVFMTALGGGSWFLHQRHGRHIDVPPVNASRPPATPLLDRAAKHVNLEVESWPENSGYAPEYLVALSAMNYVHNAVNASKYSLLRRRQQIPATLDAEKCLALNIGMCGNQMDVFDKILA